MKHYYLVDFENVADAGLEGFFQLSAEDVVYLFYSARANRINIDFIQKLMAGSASATLQFIPVLPGNQALDIQLSSFLGSLIAVDGSGSLYTVVSRDKGFGCLTSFWRERVAGVTIDFVSRIAGSIRSADASQAAAPAQALPAPVPAKATAPAPASAPVKATVQAPAPAKATAPAPAPAPVKATVQAPAPAPVKAEDPAAAKAEVPAPAKAPAKAETQPEGAGADEPGPAPETEQAAPPAGETATPETAPAPRPEQDAPAKRPSRSAPKKPAAPAEGQPGKSKNSFNISIQQTLSKAKYDTHIIGFVSSLASKAYGDSKIRQTVYRGIIKQYGQKQGLAIYNDIKALL
ncbi:MAG: hypothetical protein IK095_03265 [Oscillospiraceae bacterium]|nr:hypothetical protein [Oscillospiraceae bacterium]